MSDRDDRDVDGSDEAHRIECHLSDVLAARGITLTELSVRTGATMANLSILKNNRARAIRFTTLTLICDALDCTPQELFSIRPRERKS
ncbi:helix-turn-helix transcriptional regulator [Rathayibacter sp. AY1F9]|uniref:helix-turn-helix domain-containing protein n=1 Tax=Rathayibacter sp. AY1F9 TaxID=2080563 RepID=UPI000CE748F2|nr:helix-turn-helix transcriptional regulator [Rathayibacter sp. AY1F9]PPH25794.1 transcriptional regulator [Rathayibacter sp. AY1F9]